VSGHKGIFFNTKLFVLIHLTKSIL